MKGYYKVKQTAGGQWMFNLRAGNHEVILTHLLQFQDSGCS